MVAERETSKEAALLMTNVFSVFYITVEILVFLFWGLKRMTLMPCQRENNNIINIEAKKKLDDRQRKQLQHEFKIYMEQYFKQKLGARCGLHQNNNMG
jgi:flagellar biogenesis protein FliO